MLAKTTQTFCALKANPLIILKVFNPAAFQKLQYVTYQGIKESQDPMYTNDKLADMGSYCMEIEKASTSQVSYSGYLWCYDNPNSAPTGDDETSFLGTCAEENG